MAAYARQAKNRDLEADAVEIRMRATRRLDQLRVAQKGNCGACYGHPEPTVWRVKVTPPGLAIPTLSSQGIDKNLAKQALGSLSEDKFEAAVADARATVTSDSAAGVAAVRIDADGHVGAHVASVEAGYLDRIVYYPFDC